MTNARWHDENALPAIEPYEEFLAELYWEEQHRILTTEQMAHELKRLRKLIAPDLKKQRCLEVLEVFGP